MTKEAIVIGGAEAKEMGIRFGRLSRFCLLEGDANG